MHLQGLLGVAPQGSCHTFLHLPRQVALRESSHTGGSKQSQWHLSCQSPELLAVCFQLSSFVGEFLHLLKLCL